MKLAIIGSGKIVKDAFFALEPVENIILESIFVRPHSLEKGQDFAEKYGIREVYTDYDELLQKTVADTVYIGLVNNVHYEYAKKALLSGKNVILEKPFTGLLSETKELNLIAEENGLFIFEAITVLHHGTIREMKKALPKMGPIRMMTANFSQYSSRYEKYLDGTIEPCFDPELLGGTLMDLNVYNIHYAAELFGKPEAVNYYPNRGYNGIDTSGVLILSYPGFSAVLIAAKDSDSPGFVRIQGEKGYMEVSGKPNLGADLTITYEAGGNETERDAAGAVVRKMITETYHEPDDHHRMTQEFRDFAEMIDGKQYEKAKAFAVETETVMEILERAGNVITMK